MDRDLENDMKNSPWFLEKIKLDCYAQNIYAALCNMRWQPQDIWPVLKDEYWSCSWRSAGGIVANLRGNERYIDWYCSGIGNEELGHGLAGVDGTGFVPEGTVTEEVAKDLLKLGWLPAPWPNS